MCWWLTRNNNLAQQVKSLQEEIRLLDREKHQYKKQVIEQAQRFSILSDKFMWLVKKQKAIVNGNQEAKAENERKAVGSVASGEGKETAIVGRVEGGEEGTNGTKTDA